MNSVPDCSTPPGRMSCPLHNAILPICMCIIPLVPNRVHTHGTNTPASFPHRSVCVPFADRFPIVYPRAERYFLIAPIRCYNAHFECPNLRLLRFLSPRRSFGYESHPIAEMGWSNWRLLPSHHFSLLW